MAKVYGDRWEIVRTLRSGGQAETFVVRDVNGASGDQEFVLKRVRNPERHGRFNTEVEALRSLTHPNVVRLVDAHIEGEKPFLVMEYCVGGSLDDHPTRWSLDAAHTLESFAEICDGVAAAHAAGVTHRDIKPANILLRGNDGPPVVADFGIAYIADGERQTLTDEAVGARRFTAPELADGRAEDVSVRSDIYSLGKLLYWMLGGGSVFDREQHRTARWDLARGDVGRSEFEHVNRILDNMIVLEPSKRYGSASDAAKAARLAADFLRRRVRVLASDLPQDCTFCQQGQYVAIKMNSPIDTKNLGINPIASSEWKALVCSNCGNLQLFRPDHTGTREWWGPGGTVPPVR